MKRLLSILASVGLVATASTSVVSCTKKDQTPTYHSVADIKGTYTNQNQYLSQADIDALLGKGNAEDERKAEKDIIGTIAITFKNPTALMDDYNAGKINVDLYDLVRSNSDGTKLYELHINQVVKDNNGKPSIAATKTINMMTTSNSNYLDLSSLTPYTIDLNNNDSGTASTLMSVGVNMAQTVKSSRKDFVDLYKKSSEMMRMDSSLFDKLAFAQTNDGADKLVPVTPGFDNNSGLRYESLKQQIVASYSPDKKIEDLIKDKFSDFSNMLIDMNEQILNSIKSRVDNGNDFNQDYFDNEIVAGIFTKALNKGHTWFKVSTDANKQD